MNSARSVLPSVVSDFLDPSASSVFCLPVAFAIATAFRHLDDIKRPHTDLAIFYGNRWLLLQLRPSAAATSCYIVCLPLPAAPYLGLLRIITPITFSPLLGWFGQRGLRI